MESRVLREGFPVEDTLRPDRIVMGVATGSAEKLMRAVYEQILEAGTPLIVTDFAAGELVKVATNAFLAGRNALDRDLWRAEGWVYRALGRQ